MKINFLFGIHNHQPIGNFDAVFEESFKRCYLPFIEILERHPKIRISIHYSGPLIEWIEKNAPRFFDKIKGMIERDQIEVLSGGFYEPILSSLPEDDAIGQIHMMTEFIEKKFHYTPKGIWLAERIWGPLLPTIISKAGMKYTILDDTHFFYAGLKHKDMFGYYVTEKDGYTLSVFPIDKFLRYSIPFKLPHETLDYLRRAASEYNLNGVTYADDGEKFGVWPSTHKWVYEENWLENFFTSIEDNLDWIEMPTFSEYIERFSPNGRIYLPMASYEEMMEWALPTEAGHGFEEMLHDLENRGIKDKYKSFIRGGLWDNFLTKYDESNLMHKKMLYVSEKLRKIRGQGIKKIPPELRELYRGQCNCAYWHGLFGGLYLNYLRHAVYEHLIEAENIIDKKRHRNKNWIEYKVIDYDKDTQNEVLISNSKVNAYFDPDYGGSLFEFDYRPKRFNLSNTLTRREESYHYKIKSAESGDHSSGSTPKSIHDIVKVKEDGLGEIIVYDRYQRRSFIDHFFGEETDIKNFMMCSYPEIGDFVDKQYKIEDVSKSRKGIVSLKMKRIGSLQYSNSHIPVSISKIFHLSKEKSGIASAYEITNMGDKDIDIWFGIEFNLTLLAGDSDLRYYISFDGFHPEHKKIMERFKKKEMSRLSNLIRVGKVLKNIGNTSNTKYFGMRDDWNHFQIILSFEEPASIWYFPIETVSQSEDGFERTYQGSTILSHWNMKLSCMESKIIELGIDVEEF
ncbi:MAG: alpha-amylase/4-alpha-glucanotransferase domain-containing protein [Nitrospinota bacterium]